MHNYTIQSRTGGETWPDVKSNRVGDTIRYDTIRRVTMIYSAVAESGVIKPERTKKLLFAEMC